MGRYKVGDIVQVRKDLILEEEYDDLIFVEEMAEYMGKVFKVTKLNPLQNDWFFLNCTTSWWFCDEMVTPISTTEPVKMTEQEICSMIKSSEAFLDILEL